MPYTANRARAEQILLEVARRHTTPISELSEAALKEMERRYFMHRSEISPQVFWRLTDKWLEMAVRFVTKEFGNTAPKGQDELGNSWRIRTEAGLENRIRGL